MNELKLPTCKIIIDQPLKRSNIRQFRAKVSEEVGPGNVLFHGHSEDADRPLRYRYPLVQYKVQHSKAAIVGIGEGAKQIRQFIDEDGICFAGSFPILARVDENFKLGVATEMRPYYLAQWLALNPANYKRWQFIENEQGHKAELERILAAHLLSFAAGVGYDVPGPKGLIVEIQEWAGPRRASYHGSSFSSFDVRFQSNMYLPLDIGLGKSASHGFGCVRKPQGFIRKGKYRPAHKSITVS